MTPSRELAWTIMQLKLQPRFRGVFNKTGNGHYGIAEAEF